MKILFLLDKKIDITEFVKLQRMYSSFYQDHADIQPTYFQEWMDFSDYPVYKDSDGDFRPTFNYLSNIGKDVHKRYSGEGTDHIVLLIHEDNWKSDPDGPGGIWGTNYSNVFSGYQLQYCRWDRDNIANSFGTLYHEIHHSHDAIIDTYLGIKIQPLVGVTNWDSEVTHGGSPKFDYIRYKENSSALRTIAPYLKAAYGKRDAIYQQKVGKLKKTVSLLQQILILTRQLINKKNGIKK